MKDVTLVHIYKNGEKVLCGRPLYPECAIAEGIREYFDLLDNALDIQEVWCTGCVEAVTVMDELEHYL